MKNFTFVICLFFLLSCDPAPSGEKEKIDATAAAIELLGKLGFETAKDAKLSKVQGVAIQKWLAEYYGPDFSLIKLVQDNPDVKAMKIQFPSLDSEVLALQFSEQGNGNTQESYLFGKKKKGGKGGKGGDEGGGKDGNGGDGGDGGDKDSESEDEDEGNPVCWVKKCDHNNECWPVQVYQEPPCPKDLCDEDKDCDQAFGYEDIWEGI